MELPSRVPQLTTIADGHGVITGVGGDAVILIKQIGSLLLIDLQREVEAIIQQSEVDTEVIAVVHLPAHVGETNLLWTHGIHVQIFVTRHIGTYIEIVLTGLTACLSPTGTKG